MTLKSIRNTINRIWSEEKPATKKVRSMIKLIIHELMTAKGRLHQFYATCYQGFQG